MMLCLSAPFARPHPVFKDEPTSVAGLTQISVSEELGQVIFSGPDLAQY
jgi:hypothetical protein